jgi:hypothetical protein
MPAPEAAFKTSLREAFTKLYGNNERSMTGALSGAIGQPSGLPDRYFGTDGRFVWVEAKVKGKHRITPLQDLQLRRLANCGQNATVVTLLNHEQPREHRMIEVARYRPEAKDQHIYFEPFARIKEKVFWERLMFPDWRVS